MILRGDLTRTISTNARIRIHETNDLIGRGTIHCLVKKRGGEKEKERREGRDGRRTERRMEAARLRCTGMTGNGAELLHTVTNKEARFFRLRSSASANAFVEPRIIQPV